MSNARKEPEAPSAISPGEAPEGGAQPHPLVPARPPDLLNTLLGRAFVERREGRPQLSASEAQAIALFPDDKVREIAANLGCTSEALAAELGPWVVRSI